MLAVAAEARVVPLPARGVWGAPSPENFEFFDLQMVCFGVFCGAKFHILVTTKSCKNHYIKCMENESGCDKEKPNICCHFF